MKSAYPGGFREYMAVKKRKLQEQTKDFVGSDTKKRMQDDQILSLSAVCSSSSLPSSTTASTSNHNLNLNRTLFENLIIYIDGYTGPTMGILQMKELVYLRGGQTRDHLDPEVTHVIAVQLTDSKIRLWRNKHVVKPEWLLQSIKANKILAWTNFKLIQHQYPWQKTIRMAFKNNLVNSLSNEKNEKMINPSSSSSSSDDILLNTNNSSLEENYEDKSTDYNIEKIGDEAIEDDENNQHREENAHQKLSNVEQLPHHWYASRPTIDMQSDWVKQNSSVAPDFVNKYFESSRLHHISTWKNDLKEFVRKEMMQRKNRFKPQSPDVLSSSTLKGNQNATLGHKMIMHVDMDCFFASVSTRKKTELADKPVVVAHSSGSSGKSTSEIASCNYMARSYGVCNGMSIGKARELCPSLQVVPYDFEGYVVASKAVYNVLLAVCDDIQAVSVDEAYIDVSSTIISRSSFLHADNESEELLLTKAKELAEKIRKDILEATQCTASIGISSNILLARLATRHAKPDGVFCINEENKLHILNMLSVKDIPGIGWSLSARLMGMKIETCEDLKKLSLSDLQREFGAKTGTMLYQFSRGIDERSLQNQERKSVGAEVNWGIRFSTEDQVEQFFKDLAAEVCKRLVACERKGKMLTLKVKKRKSNQEAYKILGCGDCDNFSKSTSLLKSTDERELIFQAAYDLYRKFAFDPEDLRGIGIHLTKLEESSSNSESGQQEAQIFQMWKKQQKNHSLPNIVTRVETDKRNSNSVLSSRDGNFSHNVYNFTKSAKTTSPTKNNDEGMNASLNQEEEIDMDVFHELPSEIQRELAHLVPKNQVSETELMPPPRSSSSKAKEKTNILRDTNLYSAPNFDTIAEKCTTRKSSNFQSSDLDISASQIDPEVLGALPEDLQNEVKTSLMFKSKFKKKSSNPKPSETRPKQNLNLVLTREIIIPSFHGLKDVYAIKTLIEEKLASLQCTLERINGNHHDDYYHEKASVNSDLPIHFSSTPLSPSSSPSLGLSTTGVMTFNKQQEFFDSLKAYLTELAQTKRFDQILSILKFLKRKMVSIENNTILKECEELTSFAIAFVLDKFGFMLNF